MYAKFNQGEGRFAFSVEDNGGAEITDAAYQALFAGQEAGETIGADSSNLPVLIPRPAPDATSRVAALLARVDAHLDAGAAIRRYDNIRSAALRAGYPGPFRAEGVAYATWMDSTYAACYQILAQWEAGDISEPTADELLAMLPVLVLP